jgi:thiamine biosynthesis lipoprotein
MASVLLPDGDRLIASFPVMGGSGEIIIESTTLKEAKIACDTAIKKIYSLELKFSRYLDTSWLSTLNLLAEKKAVPVDHEIFNILKLIDATFEISNGAFDPTSGVLRRVWDFSKAKIPPKEEIESLLALIGWKKVKWDENSIYLPQKGMELDFGGLVKEYAVDVACHTLTALGFNHALVNLGGDVAVTGPRLDGLPWQIGIKSPYDRSSLHGLKQVINLSCGSIATSGDYERYFIDEEGIRYSHILDPRTGYPIKDSFRSISVLHSGGCVTAGLLATTAILLGRIKGGELLDTEDLNWFAV